MEIQTKVEKKRTQTHQYTNVNFSIKENHNIKIEFIPGALGGAFRTDFKLLVDNEWILRKTLRPFLIQRMKHSFEVENIDCSIKYIWISGIWFGHIYINNKKVC